MRILAIETSCDETAIAIIEGEEREAVSEISLLADVTLSQVDIHREWGGVVPNLAKREHSRNLVPILKQALTEANVLESARDSKVAQENEIKKILEREPELAEALLAFSKEYQPPPVDAIAVTHGPGLEPALWVGINFAKALALLWQKPVIPVNHMEGHIYSVLFAPGSGKKRSIQQFDYPAIALLISGGHTELLLIKDEHAYERLGETRDDAAGEAFDKVARILGLPYPGGPEISRIAGAARGESRVALPRPMIGSGNYDFSFSGIKTAVVHMAREHEPLTAVVRSEIACEFEEAVTDVLVAKTIRAAKECNARTILVGGGVAANKKLRQKLRDIVAEKLSGVALLLPDPHYTGDNAAMIALAAYGRARRSKVPAVKPEDITARGHLVLQ